MKKAIFLYAAIVCVLSQFDSDFASTSSQQNGNSPPPTPPSPPTPTVCQFKLGTVDQDKCNAFCQANVSVRSQPSCCARQVFVSGGGPCPSDLDACFKAAGYQANAQCLIAGRQCPCPKIHCAKCYTLANAEKRCSSTWSGNESQPVCTCKANFGGVNCSEPSVACKSNPCNGNGQCIERTDGTFRCSCKPGFLGEKCDITCGSTCSIAGTANCTTVALEKDFLDLPVCICKPGFVGSRCDKLANATCDLKCSQSGECRMDYGTPYCNCSGDRVGKDCETTTVASECSSVQALSCILGVRLNGKDKDTECARYAAYLDCATSSRCSDMQVAWCATGIAAKCPNLAPRCLNIGLETKQCNNNTYATCYAQEVANPPKYACARTAGLARCAEAAWCPDLLTQLCRNPTNCAVGKFPKSCSSLKNTFGLVEDPHFMVSTHDLLKATQKHHSRNVALYGVLGAVIVIAAVVIVAVGIVLRRRRAASAGEYIVMTPGM